MLSLDTIIPVYNEEHVLPTSIATLVAFMRERMAQYRWSIVIADNASTDGTLRVATELAEEYPEVRWLHLDLKGRGRALRAAWSASQADIVSYMDVDLSTDLESYPALAGAIAQGYDVALGSRLMPSSETTRSPRREVLSRGYNLIIKAGFQSPFSDAQCGFKAISQRSVRELVPLIQNQEWFFDTELLILAVQKGYKIKEIPVKWVEDPDSRVNIVKTVTEDLLGLLRMRINPVP
ncbi:MAG: glycosyltransferase [Dehalococcoidia bacterium]|nr:glycosyltransferase [Dehalococcoidia bacterium]